MKAWSLWQPWATLWVSGLKQYETRGHRLSYRGLVAVHATATLRPEAREVVAEYPEFETAFDDLGTTLLDLPLGAVLGIVRIVDCEPTEAVIDRISDREATFGNYGPGRWAYRAETVEIFPEPIPCKGAQGLWEWRDPRGNE